MTGISLQEFMAQNHQKKGRISKLTPFKDDILLLKKNGYSQEQILDYLRQNGLIVGKTTLNSFIKKNNSTVITDTLITSTNQQTEHSETVSTETQKSPSDKPKKGIKKFNWKDATTDGLV